MAILYLIMVQVCNILHNKIQQNSTKIEGIVAILAIVAMMAMLVSPP